MTLQSSTEAGPLFAVPEAFGPLYPPLKALDKYRRVARKNGGLKNCDRFFRQEYGAAVERQILAMQRAAFTTERPAFSPRCASGSWANTPEGIEAAVRGRQARELATAARRDREGRNDATVQALYDEAMNAKRASAK